MILDPIPYASLFLRLFCLLSFASPFFADTSNILTRIGLGDVSIPAAPSPPTVMPYPVGSQIERQLHRGYRKFNSTYNARHVNIYLPEIKYFEVAPRYLMIAYCI